MSAKKHRQLAEVRLQYRLESPARDGKLRPFRGSSPHFYLLACPSRSTVRVFALLSPPHVTGCPKTKGNKLAAFRKVVTPMENSSLNVALSAALSRHVELFLHPVLIELEGLERRLLLEFSSAVSENVSDGEIFQFCVNLRRIRQTKQLFMLKLAAAEKLSHHAF